MLQNCSVLLSQIVEWDDTAVPPPPPPPPARPMNFSDLQQGFQQWNTNATGESAFRNGILVVMGILLMVALVVYLRRRVRVRKTLNSQLRLGWELSRLVPFPFGSRIVLWWVSRTTKTHFVTLLIKRPCV